MRAFRAIGATLATGALLGVLTAPGAMAGTAPGGDGDDEAGVSSELSTSSAPAKETKQASEVNCYDLARNATHSSGYTGVQTASDVCNDVNFRLRDAGTDLEARVCFLPTSGGYHCNSWQYVSGTSWTEIATNVLSGTNYWVETRGAEGTRYQFAA